MRRASSNPEQVNLDKFYSSESPEIWKAIIGESLHYHFGYHESLSEPCTIEAGARCVVEYFYPFINEGENVLDAGCGWGGPGRMLAVDKKVHYTGLTISQSQVDYCRGIGLNVHKADMEKEDLPSDCYDSVLMIEALEHIRDKQGLLTKFRDCSNQLLLTISLSRFAGNTLEFGSSLDFCTYDELKTFLKNSGWRIGSIRSRRAESYATMLLWAKNLEAVYGNEDPPGQLLHLKSFVQYALENWVSWCRLTPLVDIVARPA